MDDYKIWNEYLSKCQKNHQDIYFTPEYYALYEKNGDGKALCFLYFDGNDIAMYPFLLNRIDTVAYKLDKEYFDIQGAYGYNGVIYTNSGSEFRNNFHKAFQKYCYDTNIIAEFTRFHPIIENYKFSEEHLSVLYNRDVVFLDIEQSEEEIWQNSYSSNNRNMIRKAIKNNILVEINNDEKSFDDFQRMYLETMQNVEAEDYYCFNKTYFRNFQKLLGENQLLISAIYNGEMISGTLIMTYKSYAHYHLSGRRREFANLASNNLVLDYAVNYAKKIGCKYFHFGGGTTIDEKDNLLKFKSNFSKTTKPFYIGKKVHNQEIYDCIIEKWEVNNSEKKEKFKDILLKYHM